MKEDEIINRVTGSALVTLNLEDFLPKTGIAEIDLKNLLFQGLILREKDIRDYIKNQDWNQFQDKQVAVFCSADAVIPTWAYMLISIALQPHAAKIVFGDRNAVLSTSFKESLDQVDWEKFRDAKVVIKGCSDQHVPESAYVEAATHLRKVAASIMYGEPCSTVPLYKRPK
ncbi:MAG TPA: DUF2480 family protein [Cyclobacteriaceae bacterium]|nr:DUF2480 family protein [Cyclobacteriaceae bacterium]